MNQNYDYRNVRTAAILTNSYVAGTVIGPTASEPVNVGLNNQLIVYASFTIGSLTSASIKVEFSHDGTTYFQVTNESIVSGTNTLTLGVATMTATGNYIWSMPCKAQYIKISAIGTGTVTSSSMTITAAIATA